MKYLKKWVKKSGEKGKWHLLRNHILIRIGYNFHSRNFRYASIFIEPNSECPPRSPILNDTDM